jgi:hypothetical protein
MDVKIPHGRGICSVAGEIADNSAMAQPTVKISNNLPGTLPGVPKRPLDAQQQLEALRRTQAQAEQRVKLGVQLFKAAEARTAQHRDDVEQLRKEQDQLRQQLQQDIARSFQSYDQWIAKVDDTLTNSLKSIEDRIELLQSRWKETEQRIETMMDRSQTLLSQSADMMQTPPQATFDEPQSAPPLALSQAPQPDDVAGEGEDAQFNPIFTRVLRRLNADRNGDNDGPRAA